MSKGFYSVKDIQKILGYSESKSYALIKELNIALKEKYDRENKKIMILRGRIPIWFFEEMTGMKEVNKNEI